MAKIAQVLVNIPARTITKTFSYTIPEQLDYVDAGWRVLVPFGSRQVEGFVMSVTQGDSSKLKNIHAALDEYEWFDDNMIQTAQWISDYYLCPLSQAMRLFIPGKTGIKIKKTYHIADTTIKEVSNLLNKQPEQYYKLYAYLDHRGPTDLAQLKKVFGINTLKIVQYLQQNKVICQESSPYYVGLPKFKKVLYLSVSPDAAKAYCLNLNRKPAQYRLLIALIDQGHLENSDLKQLKMSRDTIRKLIEAGLAYWEKVEVQRNSYADVKEKLQQKQLTPEQQKVLALVSPCIKDNIYHSFLLHGVTGSGKTQIYLEVVANVRRKNRQAIVLVPEIALTSQIVSRFQARFGSDVVVIHSKLSVSERHDAWRRLRNGQAGIVIGARSAVFAPLTDIGVIIIDEEHEFTYKQEESPRYDTRQVAHVRAKLNNAVVIMGSATPSIEAYYRSLQGESSLLSMRHRIDGSSMPEVMIVDMREELRCGRRSVISLPLQELLTETFNRGEQAIILLNRRGYATFVLCRECGHVLHCDQCSSSLVYHNTDNVLQCHYCQTKQAPPDICPSCGSRYIRYFGTGTQKLEEELTTVWPQLRTVRMDQDTTHGKMAHAKIIADFAKRKYDVLLGTQMVAKGHDIHNVTAVGIITIDTALNLPDFRAAEKTFSLLTQAAGRAGRGKKPGQVIVQTYNPEHYAIKAGATHDYLTFFNQEIALRKELFYPPFSHIIKMTITSSDECKARELAERLVLELERHITSKANLEIIGPFNAPIYKIKNTYRVNILIKTTELEVVRPLLCKLGITANPDVIIDVEPLNVM